MRLRTDNVTWQELDGELVILDLENSVYLSTNAAGALLAKQLVDECTVDALVSCLVAEFGIDRKTAQHDTEAFLRQLDEKHLLV